MQDVMKSLLSKAGTTDKSTQIPKIWNSATKFSATLTMWAICSVFTLVFAIVIVTKLDVSFFEANGMIANPELREAFYYQVFDFEPITVALLAFGLLAVSLVSYIFAKSQVNYFKQLSVILNTFADTGEAPVATRLGTFTPFVERFLNVTSLKLRKEKEDTVKAVMGSAIRDWPASPRVYWMDQAQFVIGAGFLAVLFSIVSLLFFLRVNERVVDLSRKLVIWTTPTGPGFFHEQLQIVKFVGVTILGVMCIAFIITGLRYGQQMANSTYSVLRDLRRFMEGNTKQRLLLRSGDLGREHIPHLNRALEKLATKL